MCCVWFLIFCSNSACPIHTSSETAPAALTRQTIIAHRVLPDVHMPQVEQGRGTGVGGEARRAHCEPHLRNAPQSRNRAIEPLTHKVRVGDGMAAIQTKNSRADRKAEAAVIVVVFVCQITSDYITQIC